MASTRAVLSDLSADQECAIAWAHDFAANFARVALFCVDGTHAALLRTYGLAEEPHSTQISLIEQTPLRWTLEAAAPLIGAGRAPGGASIARHLGFSAPRSYAVLPLVRDDRLLALAYLDHAELPLPMEALGPLIDPRQGGELPAQPRPVVRPRRHVRRKARRLGLRPGAPARPSAAHNTAAPVVEQATEASGWMPDDDGELAELLAATSAPRQSAASPTSTPWVPPTQAPAKTLAPPPPAPLPSVAKTDPDLADALPPEARITSLPWPPTLPSFDDPLPSIPLEQSVPAQPTARTQPARRGARPWQAMLLALASALLTGAGAMTWAMSPPLGAGEIIHLEVAHHASLGQIARDLGKKQLLRQPRLFVGLARLLKLDRSLRAGVYDIPTGLWPWQLLNELHRGQVQTVQVTVPEGLTLQETAALIGRHGLLRPEDFVAAARDVALLKRYHIDGSSAEGFLFPETYRVIRGVSARDMVDAMVRQFFRRLSRLPHAASLSHQQLFDRVILASLIERETRDKGELRRVAGVFNNRLEQDLRLESCASVQYALGHPKERLQLDDIRIPSPYNTYLHPGLPPGPIANPSADALAAALDPEIHPFLFFFALDDGSHHHYFSRTFAEHQKAHRALGKK